MNNQLSVGEWICQDFGRYLKSLEAEGRCVFLPFEIKPLHLKNVGRFSEKDIDFGNGVTVVCGGIGAGKTTVIKAIASVSGSQVRVKSGENSGEIALTLPDGSVLHQDVFDAENVRCIVLDDAGERLDRERYYDFLLYLHDLDTQLLLFTRTMEHEDSFNSAFPDCRFIDLNGV